ncbi:heme peroxidase [Mycena galopus ATCC 62051]|nr:heme peroxidase [Mycena galopus ATCC 62051]
MRLHLAVFLHLVSCCLVAGAAVFHWPDPAMDGMDEILYNPLVSVVSTLAQSPVPCAERDSTTIAAQWLRIVYHDVATHDNKTGTGGLDASIAFELDRAENIGVGMRATLVDFLDTPNEHVGMADVLAMGAINAVISCGGPIIPFRGGRIDATEAGPATVPQPQQDLTSHTAAFARQGFNATEMISLVACGHSLGGVRQVDFPLIVAEADASTGVQSFSSTVGFENTIVTEYLEGTTAGNTGDVLIVGANITTRSDLRIFSSDGNLTMQSMASTDSFNQICANLIERMLNTVPSTVTLTDTIEPINFKVWNTMLFPQGGSLAFLATLKIIDSELTPTVTLFWKERTGTFCPDAGCSAPSFQVTTEAASPLATLKNVTGFQLHSFNASIDLATSIGYFWFEVDNNDGSAPFIVDNLGTNYTIDQDVLLFDGRRSSFGQTGLTMVAAVKNTSAPVTVSGLNTISGNSTASLPSTLTADFELSSRFPPADGYTFYSTLLPLGPASTTIHATVNGAAYSVWVPLLSAAGLRSD